MRVVNNPRRAPPRRAVNRQTTGYSITNIPVGQATTVRQPMTNKTHVERAREQVGTFAISPTTPIGSGQQYLLNPLTLAGTRLQRLAQNYQKFRFRRVALTVQSSASTSVGGLYVVGYNSNPDAELAPGFGAVQQVTTLPGATSANAWRTVTVPGRLEDRGTWYNLDPDSEEIMKTTQGYFAIVAQIPSTGTGPTQYAVWLDYEVEFSGSAVNPVPDAVGLMPAGTWTNVPNTNTAVFAADPGEPAFPPTSNFVTYLFNPVFTITDFYGNEANVLAGRQQSTANNPWTFYTSMEDSVSDARIAIPASFKSPRTVLSRAP